jgi:hypothetical protein
MPASTAHTVLVLRRPNWLTYLDRSTGEPIRRYEPSRPGDLLHMGVSKLGKVLDGCGWHYVMGSDAAATGRPAPACRRTSTASP